SNLSIVHPARDRTVHLVERSLAARHARSARGVHLGGRDSARRAIPGADFSGVCELPGGCPSLGVGGKKGKSVQGRRTGSAREEAGDLLSENRRLTSR